MKKEIKNNIRDYIKFLDQKFDNEIGVQSVLENYFRDDYEYRYYLHEDTIKFYNNNPYNRDSDGAYTIWDLSLEELKDMYTKICIVAYLEEIYGNGTRFEDVPSVEDCRLDSDSIDFLPQEECRNVNDEFSMTMEHGEEIIIYYSMDKNDEGSNYTMDYEIELD